jgi:DNA-binding NarL/FixJ family response regulator
MDWHISRTGFAFSLQPFSRKWVLGCWVIVLAKSIIQVLLAEDFQPYRAMVTSLLSADTHFQVICETSDGVEAAEQARLLGPDVILMDIGLRNLNGFEAARRIREFLPAAKIVFLTRETDADVMQEAFNLGAAGYIFKQRTRSDLLPALAAIVEGKQFVSEGSSDGQFAPRNGQDGAY